MTAHHHPIAIVRHYRIDEHGVRVVKWFPGRYAHAVVTYGQPRSVPTWARGSFAAINGGTFSFRTHLPVGMLRHGGVWANRTGLNHPTVGFLRNGNIVFGAAAAERAGAGNIVAGEAYLIRGGIRQTRFPWASTAQITCGPRGSDGPNGCFRSCVVRFKGGRVGIAEVGFASMPQAARVLHRLGVVDAITFDSGGSATSWVRGRSSYGITSALGMTWQRPVHDAIVVRAR